MTERQGLCGTLFEASHPGGLKWLSMWENTKNHPTGQAPKGGIGGKAEKRPFFIPHIAAKIGVNVGMVLKSRKYNYGMYAGTTTPADWLYSKTELSYQMRHVLSRVLLAAQNTAARLTFPQQSKYQTIFRTR